MLEIKRLFSEKIKKASQDFPVLVLTGARQVGKTTLLKSLFPTHTYVSLDLPSQAELAEKDPEAFLQKNPAPLLIDEAQYAPRIFRHLKILVDQNRHDMGKFILTGSQKFPLMKEVTESLAGRAAVFELEGLSIPEIETVFDLKKDLNHLLKAMIRGSFPELWRNQQASESIFFESYLITYLERDIKQIININKTRDFEKFVRLCAIRTGQTLNKSDFAKDLGLSLTTISEWLNALEASNQISILEPWSGNLGKRVTKTPKLYFSDVGFAAWLMGLDFDSLLKSDRIGALWETWIYSELRKWRSLQSKREEIFYYRDQLNQEVDFVVLSGNNVRLLESKWTQNPSEKDTRPLENVAELFSKHPQTAQLRKELAVVCRTPNRYPITSKTQALSIFDLKDSL